MITAKITRKFSFVEYWLELLVFRGDLIKVPMTQLKIVELSSQYDQKANNTA